MRSVSFLSFVISTLPLVAEEAKRLPIPTWKMVRSLDSDKNGFITPAEFHSSDEVFKKIDQDADDRITHEEIIAARKKASPAPVVGAQAPKVSALNPKTKQLVDLAQLKRPTALLFGTHT